MNENIPVEVTLGMRISSRNFCQLTVVQHIGPGGKDFQCVTLRTNLGKLNLKGAGKSCCCIALIGYPITVHEHGQVLNQQYAFPGIHTFGQALLCKSILTDNPIVQTAEHDAAQHQGQASMSKDNG